MAPVTYPMLPSARFAAVQRDAKRVADDILQHKGLGAKVVAHGARVTAGVLAIAATPIGAVADLLKFNRGSLSTYANIFWKGLTISAGCALVLGVAAASPMTGVMALAWGAAASLVFSPLAHAAPNVVSGAANWAFAKVAQRHVQPHPFDRSLPLQVEAHEPSLEMPFASLEEPVLQPEPLPAEPLQPEPRAARRVGGPTDEPHASAVDEAGERPRFARLARGEELHDDVPEAPAEPGLEHVDAPPPARLEEPHTAEPEPAAAHAGIVQGRGYRLDMNA